MPTHQLPSHNPILPDRRKRSSRTELVIIFAKTTPLFLIFSLLTWALVRHGEQTRIEAESACKDRDQQVLGFEGDPDFYGLGIRVGL